MPKLLVSVLFLMPTLSFAADECKDIELSFCQQESSSYRGGSWGRYCSGEKAPAACYWEKTYKCSDRKVDCSTFDRCVNQPSDCYN